ncbi:hypothetical protein ACTOJ1_001315 [Shigella flexneri]
MTNVNTIKRVSFGINGIWMLLMSIAFSMVAYFYEGFFPAMLITVALSACLAICGIVSYTIFLKVSFSAPRTFYFSTSEIFLALCKLPALLVIQGMMSKYWFNMPACAAILWLYAFMIMAYKIRFWKV